MIQMQLSDNGIYWPILTCALCTHAVVRSGYVLWTVDPTTALPNSAPSLTHPDCREPFAAQWSDVTWGQLELPQFMGLLSTPNSAADGEDCELPYVSHMGSASTRSLMSVSSVVVISSALGTRDTGNRGESSRQDRDNTTGVYTGQ